MGFKETRMQRHIINALQYLIRIYQKLRPPAVGAQCRFVPTCSCYAKDALDIYGLKALPKIIGRLCRCHPLGSRGIEYDPVKHDTSLETKI